MEAQGQGGYKKKKAATGFDNIYQGTVQEQYQQEPQQRTGERNASKDKNHNDKVPTNIN